METKFTKLNEIRDELAEQFWKRTWDNFGSDFMYMHKHYCNDNIAEYFSAGFDAAMERVKPVVDVLEEFGSIYWRRLNKGEHMDANSFMFQAKAKEALAKFNSDTQSDEVGKDIKI